MNLILLQSNELSSMLAPILHLGCDIQRDQILLSLDIQMLIMLVVRKQEEYSRNMSIVKTHTCFIVFKEATNSISFYNRNKIRFTWKLPCSNPLDEATIERLQRQRLNCGDQV